MPQNNLPIDDYYLQRAINNLAPFYNIPTTKDLIETIALQEVLGLRNATPNSSLRPPAYIYYLLDTLLNTTEGGLTMVPGSNNNADCIIDRLEQYTSPQGGNNAINADEINRFRRLFKIFYGGQIRGQQTVAEENPNAFARPLINSVIAKSISEELRKKLSVTFINTPQIMPTQKNTEAITIFLNGIPQIELSRASPYINIQFLFGRPALDANQRLNAMSIFKFLEGAVNVEQDSPLRTMVEMNRITSNGRVEDQNSQLITTAGMELFNASPMMINMNEPSSGNNLLRATPVKDKTRPFLTFKALNIDVAPSVGLFSFKTAKLEFVLHDSSRLHELADFIRPDLYGSTELLLEYGWMHPDGPDKENYYADILNFSRTKEKYGIRNISITFDEVRQANVTLDLFMKGSNDLSTETIDRTDSNTNELMRTIERIVEDIGRLRQRLLGNNTSTRDSGTNSGGSRNREIRGIQFLDAAADWRNNISLQGEILPLFGQLSNQLRNAQTSRIPAAQQLSARLNELVGTIRNGSGNQTFTAQGAMLQLRNSIAQQIATKLNEITLTDDPFLPENYRVPSRDGGTMIDATRQRRGSQATTATARNNNSNSTNARAPTLPQLPQLPSGIATNVSLAKLLLLFVGVPLASTGNYADVQFIFYPFNKYAGFANGLNIGQFFVDTHYFYEQFVKFRTENLSRSSNLSLRDFTTFIANTMIDDPVASCYGIDSLYERVRGNRTTQADEYQIRGDQINYQANLERRLLTQTPDGSFRMPQINFYVEAVPLRLGTREGEIRAPDPSKTILRIHVFDRQTSAYEGQASLLNASRENVLQSLSSIPVTAVGEEANLQAHRETYTRILELASSGQNPFLRRVTNSTQAAATGVNSFEVIGGAEAIQEFVMKTMPYMIYGIQGSALKTANLSTMQDAALSSVNMLRSFRTGPLRANGEQPGGLPLSMIPVEFSCTTLGCALINFGQQFFVKLGTGTTADNIYGVSGLSHKLEQGLYETDIKFVPLDAYGRYASFTERMGQIANHLASIDNNTGNTRNVP